MERHNKCRCSVAWTKMLRRPSWPFWTFRSKWSKKRFTSVVPKLKQTSSYLSVYDSRNSQIHITCFLTFCSDRIAINELYLLAAWYKVSIAHVKVIKTFSASRCIALHDFIKRKDGTDAKPCCSDNVKSPFNLCFN